MCGIVGYVGNRQASNLLVEGLSKLEYRGYDTAGIAVINNGKVEIRKHKGRLSNLVEELSNNSAEGTIGIGHTRWATHGEPSDVNSHPHQTSKGDITVVHNGIIDNYSELTQWLKSEGYEFKSATDTEVIPNLIHYYYNGNLFEAVVKATENLEGSYALGVVSGQEPDKIVAVRKDSPLIVGIGQGETFIASDIPAVLNYTRDIYLLEDNEFVVLTNEGVEVFEANGDKINKEIYKVTWNEDAAEKGGYEHFMLKEIHDQPKAVRDTFGTHISEDGKTAIFDELNWTAEDVAAFNKILIVACGTAYHAGLVTKQYIENIVKRKAHSILITSRGESQWQDKVDIILPMTTREKLYSHIASYTSTVSIMLILDMLYSCYFHKHYDEAFQHKKEVALSYEPLRKASQKVMEEDQNEILFSK